MMKKITIFILCVIAFSAIKAQNPISYPKDTNISQPELNFEVLWHTFEDNYAFFKLRNIDWKKTYTQYRPLINAKTTDDSLYLVLSAMLTPFHDDHINITIADGKHFNAGRKSQFRNEFPNDSLKTLFWQMVNQNLRNYGFGAIQTIGPEFRNTSLFSYAASKEYGYLKFNRCFIDLEMDSVLGAEMTGKFLDSVLIQFKNLKGLIIDIRVNMGGDDEFAFEVASRFAREKIIGMYKKARISGAGYEDFGKPQTWLIEPKRKKIFSKSVILLTSDRTVSAGDVFAMIMKELPSVKLVGTNACGVYSDVYDFTLPNKWEITLSNQRYYNNKMICYEGKGTPVNIKVKNTRADLKTMTDPVLKIAINQLKNK
jgi:carboxyl-terminal processing protease